ncbi:hypothetical protein Leryth_016593 [Lithospermum erythrorhizon]|nr:hypothetical protein Leryth_016593 [Lithospermum erythrorhizon]
MLEETKDADKNEPKGIISSIGVSIIVEWGYILGITFAVNNIPELLSEDNDVGGYAIAQIFYQGFKSRYGNGVGGIICLGIPAIAIYFCGMSSVTSNSRWSYAIVTTLAQGEQAGSSPQFSLAVSCYRLFNGFAVPWKRSCISSHGLESR